MPLWIEKQKVNYTQPSALLKSERQKLAYVIVNQHCDES